MKRILFVDDDPNVIGGLRNLLRKQRKIWEMIFALGGENALQEIRSRPIDVVVTDMRMPGIDGVALLRHVRDIQPKAARIVLSGATSLEDTILVVPLAHQFLSKPCDPVALEAAVTRSCALQDLITNDKIRELVGKTDDLPSVPHVYTMLTEALANPDTSLDDIANIVERDIAMSAKVLKLVNSAFFGLAQKTTNIGRAVAYLGTTMLKSLVLTLAIFGTYKEDPNLVGFSLAGMERHSWFTGRMAMRLVSNKKEKEAAFTAAVLHDIGKLILATRQPHLLADIINRSRAESQPMHVIEKEMLGMTHAEIGAFLLGLWNLPLPLVEAVANHHEPTRLNQKTFDLVSVVHVADLLVHEQISPAPDGCDQSLLMVDKDYLATLGVAESLPQWREAAINEIKEADRSLS